MAVTAKEMVEKYMQAEMDVLEGKTVIFGGRTLTMADLDQIREGRLEWERRVASDLATRRCSRPYALATFQ